MDGTNRHVGGADPATVGARASNGTLPDALASLISLADNTINLSLLFEQLKAPVGVVPFVGAGMYRFKVFPLGTSSTSEMTDEMPYLATRNGASI